MGLMQHTGSGIVQRRVVL